MGALAIGLAVYSGQDPDTAPLSERAIDTVAVEQTTAEREQQPAQNTRRPSLSKLLFGHG